MRRSSGISALFGVAAAYDGILGVLFLFAADYVFQFFRVTPPNHLGYVQFPAALLLIFALMFLRIAGNPIRHRDLVPYGILLKVAYCAVSGWHWLAGGIPGMWKPFAVIDLLMGLAFIWAYATLRSTSGEVRPA